MISNLEFKPDERNIFERAKELDFPFGHYVIVGGSMEAHGIRKARDIDVVVDSDLFDHLESLGWTPYYPRPSFMGETWNRLEKDGVQINSEISWAGTLFSETHELIEKAEIIEGLPFAQLEILVKWKTARGREKDLKDIELISNYLLNKA